MFTSNGLKLLLSSFILIILLFSYVYVNTTTERLKNNILLQDSIKTKNLLGTMIKNKQSSLFNMTLALAHSKEFQKAISKKDFTALHLDKLSKKIAILSNYRGLVFQIIDHKGISRHRSWMKKTNDDLSRARSDVKTLITNPQVLNTISVGKHDMTFKSMVPIYNNQKEFIGIVETISRFHSIVEALKEQHIDSLLLVDKSFRTQIVRPYSKTLIGNYYVGNYSKDSTILSYVTKLTPDYFFSLKQDYIADELHQYFVVTYPIYDLKGRLLAQFILSKNLSELDTHEVLFIKEQFNIFILIVSFLAITLIFFITKKDKAEQLTILEIEVDNKTHELESQRKTLDYKAHHDTLTDLPNRLYFLEAIEERIQSSQEHQAFTLLFLDLDRFKEINDSLGHLAGDFVLIQTAKRLKESFNYSEVARLGGDEFIIILDGDLSKQNIVSKINTFIHNLCQPMTYKSHTLHTDCSIGISYFPEHGKTVYDLLKNADAAMYRAKKEAQKSYVFYKNDFSKQIEEKLALENRLRTAVKNNVFEMFYQAQYDTKEKKVTGVEALVRWQDKDQFVSPYEFITLAEESNLILSLGRLIITNVMQDLQAWQDEGITLVKTSINLSTKQLQDEGLIDFILDQCKNFGIKSDLISFEITESFILNDPDQAITKLQALKDEGFGLALDDFGTGYSSLSYLKRLPIDTLKIDKSFLDFVPQKHADCTIVKSIIDLAKGMNLHIVCEGVEEAMQEKFLREYECFCIQGFFFYKPMPANEMKSLLQGS